jgi:hypothetical protein
MRRVEALARRLALLPAADLDALDRASGVLASLQQEDKGPPGGGNRGRA